MKITPYKQERIRECAINDFDELILPSLKQAVETFRKHDNQLLLAKANERAITHRFAIYLERHIKPKAHVDCEYNRSRESNPKRFSLDEENYKTLEEKLSQELMEELAKSTNGTSSSKEKLLSSLGLSVFPDIIVHKRGDDSRNLLVIEAKKDSEASALDCLKLTLFTTRLKYNFGLFIQFGNGTNKLVAQLWSNGECLNQQYSFDVEGKLIVSR